MLSVFPWSGTLPPGTCPYVCDDNLPCSIGLWDDLKGACCFCQIGPLLQRSGPLVDTFLKFCRGGDGWGYDSDHRRTFMCWCCYVHVVSLWTQLSLSKAVGFGWSFSALFVVFWARLLSDLRALVVKQINPYWHFSSQDVVCKAMRAMLLVVVLSWA